MFYRYLRAAGNKRNESRTLFLSALVDGRIRRANCLVDDWASIDHGEASNE